MCRPPSPGTPGPLSRPTPEALGGLLEAAGFSGVEAEEAEVTFEWRLPEEFTTFIEEIAPPITAMIAPHPREVRDETWGVPRAAALPAPGGNRRRRRARRRGRASRAPRADR